MEPTSAHDGTVAPAVVVASGNRDRRQRLAAFLRARGYRVEAAADGETALNAIESLPADAVVADSSLHRLDGLRLLGLLRRRLPEVCFVLVVDHPDVDVVSAAIREGAHDVQGTPLDLERLATVLDRGVTVRRLRRRVDTLEHRLERKFGFENLVGNSAAMVAVFTKIRQIAPARATVLITGETGTGKELVASAIHYNSPRADQPFVKLNCAALSEGIIESELFGHERGAFTGAVRARKGRFEIADGGTLFLDEIPEITPPVQAKLLRVLQEREFERVGGSRPFKVDVRLVAATNRHLEAEVRSGRFREDLYYRLNVVTIHIPPLRERREDLPLLVEAFLREVSVEHGKSVPGVTKGAMEALRAYDWPGNVRELKNTVEGMVLFAAAGQALGVDDLPAHLSSASAEGREVVPAQVGMTLAEVERRLIAATYRASGGDKKRTAETLGIGLRTLYRKLKELEL